MTIKQQGGIFGRNPTFNEVNVEGGLSVDGSTYTNFKENGSTLGSVFVTDDKIGIGTLNNGIAFDQSSNIILPFNPQTLLKKDGALDLGYAAGKFKDLYLSGNVIVDSGKGIDFSATSGTGTSELFDDYEEGTWTPQLYDSSSTGGNLSPTSGTGFYTKVGNTVTVWCSFSNISTSGMTAGNNVWLHGFPYSNGTAEGIGAVNCDTLNFGSGKTNVVVLMYPSNALALLKQTGDNVSDANTIVSDINSGTTDIVFTVTYKV